MWMFAYFWPLPLMCDVFSFLCPSPPLTQYFLECGGLVRTDKKPALCKSYQKLVLDLWHKSRCVLKQPLFQSH